MGIKLNRSIGEIVLEISNNTGISLITVESIIYYYLKQISERLEKDRSVVISGITSLKVILDTETKEYFVRGRVSPVLRKRLLQLDTDGDMDISLSSTLVWDISDKLILPISTIDKVLRVFTEELIRQAVEKGELDIPNITNIRIIRHEDGEFSTRGRVSLALQSKMRLRDVG